MRLLRTGKYPGDRKRNILQDKKMSRLNNKKFLMGPTVLWAWLVPAPQHPAVTLHVSMRHG